MSKTGTIGPSRLSYNDLFRPRVQGDVKPGQVKEEQYAATILIPKKNTELVDRVKKMIAEARAEGIATKFGGKDVPEAKFKNPLRDGDGERPDDPAYEGMYFLNSKARKERRPSVVDRDCQPITDESEVYSGCYGYFNVSFFAYNSDGSKGVGVGLNHFMKTKDGEPLVSRITAKEAFAGVKIEEEDDDEDDFLN